MAAPPPPPGPQYYGGPPQPPNFGPPPPNMQMAMPMPGMPPMPPPWDPYYAQWYSQWYYSYYGMPHPPQNYHPAPQQAQQPPQPKPAAQPPPPGFDDGPPPAKKPTLDLGAPPPPPPEEPKEELKIKPEWQAAKKGAVIYKTPRPPTPEPPKPIIPPQPLLPPPQLQEPAQMNSEKSNGKMQWFYDGQSWVYATEQPPMKSPQEPTKEVFDYSYGGSEDPVAKAVLANMRGKYNKPDKPKAVPVRCEICSLTVSCHKTYESHINGKPHKKRVAQVSKMKQLEEKVKQDAERAMNSVPGGTQPENPLQSLPNGDIYCRICDCNMNSGAQAQSHIVGVKHRHRMDKFVRGQRGRGRGRGGFFGRGGFHGMPQQPMPLMDVQVCNQVTSEEAEEEYERVFAESLANNIDVQEATKIAEEAKQSALSFCEDVELGDSAVVKQFQAENDSRFPPRGIVIISVPNAGKPGTYKCNLCSVMLPSEANLEQHLVSDCHQDSLIKSSLGSLNSNQQEQVEPQSATRARGKIYRGRPNAVSSGSMKAQRGRRGLISYGETMPDKLTKGQKKAQPKDIASILAQKAMAVGVAPGSGPSKVMPLLMSFVRGGVMEGDGGV